MYHWWWKVQSPAPTGGRRKIRVSVFKEDPGYHPAPLVEVYVNGKKANGCVMADEERGQALCIVLNNDGTGSRAEWPPRDQVQHWMVYGDVKIVPMPGFDPSKIGAVEGPAFVKRLYGPEVARRLVC